MTYENFIANKAITTVSSGINVTAEELNPMLFDFQRDIVRWALAKGRAAIFADCGDIRRLRRRKNRNAARMG